MENFKRYAVYYAPRAGAFADRASAWLGWDAAACAPIAQPDLALPDEITRPIAVLTKAPRKYGFHGTIRAPFRPRDGVSEAEIRSHLAALAASLPPAQMPALTLEDLHGFLALIPTDPAPINTLAAAVVEATNPLRDALTEAEIARRRPERLSPRQRALMDRWGYPFVMNEFRFHLTLTDALKAHEIAPLKAALTAHFAPVLPTPFVIEDLCLFGEDEVGRFHLLHRYALNG